MKQLTISSFLLISSLLFSQYSHAENSYIFAIAPQQSANKTAERWLPVLSYISEKSGIKLIFRTEKDIPAFENKLDTMRYDFAYMDAFRYLLYHEKSSYNAILKSKNMHLNSVLIVKKDSPLKTIQDLSGQTVAFPEPTEFSANRLSQVELKKRNIAFTPEYVSSHNLVFNSIIQDRVIAGGSFYKMLNRAKPEIKNNLRVLHKTKTITPHAITAHKKVPESDVKKIRNAFIEMRNDPEGNKLLKKAKLRRLSIARDKDWNDFRSPTLDK